MKHIPVVSAFLMGYGYDPKGGVLEIVHRNGEIRRYADVPEDVFARFAAADSQHAFAERELNGYPMSVGRLEV